MKICCVSDLHSDIGSQPYVKWPQADVLLVAGDTGNDLGRVEKTLKNLHKTGLYEHILFLDGNHEHYSNASQRRKIDEACQRLEYLCQDYALFLPGRDYVKIDHLYFCGINGWYSADCYGEPLENKALWPHVMNDDRYIGFRKFSQPRPWDLAESQAVEMRLKLEAILMKEPQAKIVAVTHTSPTRETISKRTEFLSTNCYYMNSYMERVLEDFRENIVLWHHGHTHERKMTEVFGVPVVVNPRGYPHENPNWEPVLVEIQVLARVHHIFCNKRAGIPDSCSDCQYLYKKWPPREGETLQEMVKRVFPDIILS